MTLKVKIHNAYRNIIAIADADLIGKRFEEGNLQIDVKESFYGGEDIDENKAIKLMKNANSDDATFNIVGKKSIECALKAGIIDKKGIIKVKSIPHALGLI